MTDTQSATTGNEATIAIRSNLGSSPTFGANFLRPIFPRLLHRPTLPDAVGGKTEEKLSRNGSVEPIFFDHRDTMNTEKNEGRASAAGSHQSVNDERPASPWFSSVFIVSLWSKRFGSTEWLRLRAAGRNQGSEHRVETQWGNRSGNFLPLQRGPYRRGANAPHRPYGEPA